MNPVDLLLERLGKYERRNGYYMASCPAHEDSRASLSVSERPACGPTTRLA